MRLTMKTVTCILLMVCLMSVNARPTNEETVGATRNPLDCSGRAADVVFVLDSSNSIWKPDFIKQLGHVSDMMDNFNLGFGEDQVRVGVVTFSDRAYVQMRLNRYGDIESVKRALGNIGYLAGGTNTAGALNLMHRVMFTNAYGSRENVAHIAIVVTDGQSRSPDRTMEEAATARALGIQVFAIGVGPAVDVLELHGIASEPASQFVFQVNDYEHMGSIIDALSTRACAVTTVFPSSTSITKTELSTATTEPISTEISMTTTESTTPTTAPTTNKEPTASTNAMFTDDIWPEIVHSPKVLADDPNARRGDIPVPFYPDLKRVKEDCLGGKPAELFFILDSSTSIYVMDFKKLLGFVNDVIANLDIGPTKTRVGVSVFSDKVNRVIDLDEYYNKDGLTRAISTIKHTGGITNTGEAIQDMRLHRMSKGKSRAGAARIVIVITDGQSRDPRKTAEQSYLAKREGITMYAIGIGQALDEEELKMIGSEPSDQFVYMVDNFNLLEQIKQAVAASACNVKEMPTPPPADSASNPDPVCHDVKTDLMFLVDSLYLGAEKSRKITAALGESINRLHIGPSGLNVGYLSNACVSGTDVGPQANKDNFLAHLDISTLTALEPLIHKLRKGVYRRDDAEKVAVVFLDNKLVQAQKIVRAAQMARYYGIRVYVIAIGNEVNKREVEAVSSMPAHENAIYVNSYDDISDAIDHLLFSQCVGDFLIPEEITS